ncbi:unnamed protein product [Closterium sp. NIES-54]
MYITLYFIVTRLPDSLRAVRDHFHALDPTDLTINLLEKHLFADETSVVDVVRTSGLFLLLVGRATAARARVARVVAVAAGVVVVEAVEAVEVAEVAVGVVAGVGASVAAVVAAVGVVVAVVAAAVGVVAEAVVAVGVKLFREEVLAVARGSSSSVQARPLCPSSFTCGKFHTQHRYFSRLDDARRAEFGDKVERPRWLELLKSGVDIFALDYDAILAAMYALTVSADGDYYLCVPPDPGIEAAALDASESALPSTTPAEALHTFTLDLGASRCFIRDSTTLAPLPAHVPVRLADPSEGPFLARSSTVLPCPAVLSGSLSGLHLLSFSTNLVSTAALQDAMVTTTTPGGQRVSICTCTRTGHNLATFTRRPGSSLYTLTTESPQVAASAQVSASSHVAPPCSCRLLSHQTLLWHHRLGHPSLPRLCGMHSHLLVSSLPRSLPSLPPSPAPPCLPCIKGRQRAAPQSSSFPPTTAPLQTLHIDVWGLACVSGQGRERYFLLVVDDYMRYTTIFPFRSKGEVPDILIPWIRVVHLQLHERFCEDLPFLRLHFDRDVEFSSDLLRDFFMEVARTSMIHADAPHFLWPFAVRYAAHQLNLCPRVSLLETSPNLRWTGKVGDASVFQVWGSRAFVRDTFADNLSSRAIPCSVPFYRLFPYRTDPLPPLPLFLAPGPPPVDLLPPQGPAPSVVSQVDPLPVAEPVEVTVVSGAARGAASRVAEPAGAEPGDAEPARAEPGSVEAEGAEPGVGESEGAESGGFELEGADHGGAKPEGAEPGGAEFEGAESGGAEPGGTASAEGPAGSSPRQAYWREPLSPQQLREWFARRTRLRSGVAGAGGPAAGVTGVGGPGAGDPRAGGAGARGAGAGGLGVGGPRAGGAGAGDPGAAGAGTGGAGAGGTGAGDTVERQPFFVLPPPSSLPPPGSVLRQVLSLPSSSGLTPSLLCPSPHQSQQQLEPDSPLPAPSLYPEQSLSLTCSRYLHWSSYSSPASSSCPRHSPLLCLPATRLSAPPSDESVELRGPNPELVACLMYLMTCTRPDLAYPLSILARYIAPTKHRPEH